MKIKLLISALLIVHINLSSYTVQNDQDVRDVFVIRNKDKLKSEKEAIVILSGLGDNKKRRAVQEQFFSENFNQDIYIPAYKARSSYDKTLTSFRKFLEDEEIAKYKKVHFFCYILGSWVLNDYLLSDSLPNLHTIIYDRSPLQERAPDIVIQEIPVLAKVLKGKIIKDLKGMRYAPIPKENYHIGIITENKATKLIKHFKDETLAMGEPDWDNPATGQEYDDLIYVFLNHDEMYTRFDMFGADIRSFIATGMFLEKSQRRPIDKDPFSD